LTDLIVVGGGDQGRQVISALEAGARDRVVGVLDGAFPSGTDVSGHPVLGAEAELGARAGESGASGFVVAIGDNATRVALIERLVGECPQLSLCTVVHPTASVARDATLGDGSIILAGAVVGNGCAIGRGVLVGIHASVDHDGVVGDGASLGPGVTTGGTVRIGRATALGVGANVVHGVTIGAETVVGAGALVLDDLPDCVVAYGVPARVARSRASGEPYL
jgi:sugar O-acyltransferase (sialic acid O-acetyltransferase NeuD family)